MTTLTKSISYERLAINNHSDLLRYLHHHCAVTLADHPQHGGRWLVSMTTETDGTNTAGAMKYLDEQLNKATRALDKVRDAKEAAQLAAL